RRTKGVAEFRSSQRKTWRVTPCGVPSRSSNCRTAQRVASIRVIAATRHRDLSIVWVARCESSWTERFERLGQGPELLQLNPHRVDQQARGRIALALMAEHGDHAPPAVAVPP